MSKRFLLVLCLLFIAACSSGGDDGGPTGNGGGSISISLSAASVSIPQGGNGTANVTLTRTGNFSGAVTLAITGAPSGVTATASPATIAAGSASAVITLQVGAAVAAGTSALTVRASGAGVTDATATLSLVVTAVQTGSFALTLSSPSVTITQGTSGTVTVNVTRTAPFAGAVALTATGLPAGVTAAFNPASATGATSTLTLTAAANAATGTTTLTVRGTGTGVAERTVTMSLVVNPASTGGTSTWRFCDNESVPLWFAVQNGDGAWTRVQPDNGAYRYTITAARGGVAWVLPGSTGNFDLALVYGSPQELTSQGEDRCTSNLGGYTVNGSVAGLSGTESANIALGGAFTSVFAATGTTFTLTRVADGPVDLLASRVENMFDGTTFSSIVRKLIFRRNLNPVNNSTLPVLDFNGAEAFDPVTRTLTITNLDGQQSVASAWYQTANGFVNGFFSGGASTNATRTWYGIPAARQEATDLHALQVSGFAVSGANSSLRNVLLYFREATDKTITLGPALSTPTISTAATAPYVRFRAQLPVQAEYDLAWGFSFSQGSSGSIRTVVIAVTRGWAGSVATVDITVPDFTGVAGWDSNWGPRAGVATQWSAGGSDFTPEGGPLGPIVDGGMIVAGARTGSITP